MKDELTDSLVLIAEDDPDILRILQQYAEKSGMLVRTARDGTEALQQYRGSRPDLVLLDINMPKRDGFEVLETIRAKETTPVIVVSARVEDADKLHGLGLGADDYVVKPFNPKEVVARMAAVLRRTRDTTASQVRRFGGVEVNLTEGRAFVESDGTALDGTGKDGTGKEIDLTPSEFRLLAHMIEAPRKVFSRLELLEACFPESEALERTVDSHISHLRRKLDAAGAAGLLSVMRGVGYRLAGS